MSKIWIIRFDRSVVWPDGTRSNLVSRTGSYEEVRKYAACLAVRYGLRIEAIV